jgi:2'-5' RNA ligase
MRCFIGIPVRQEAVPELARVQTALEVGRDVDPENWHITLAFLGDQPEAVLEELHESLAQLGAPTFEVTLKGVDIFGSQTPRALVALVEPTPDLVALRRAVRGLVYQAGIELPRARFRPHVTLARFSRRMTMLETQRIAGVLEAYGDLDAGRLGVERFTLYRSHLGEGGAWYEVLADYPLG